MRRALCALALVAALLQPGGGASSQDQLDPNALARVQSSLVLLTCASLYAAPQLQRQTAVVIASGPERSYLVAPMPAKCKAPAAVTAYPGGNTHRAFLARAVGVNAGACPGYTPSATTIMCYDAAGMHSLDWQFRILAIEAGHLPVARLATAPAAGVVYVLSFANPAVDEPLASQLEPRLNSTSIAAGQQPFATQIVAARGISAGGAVFNARGEIVGLVADYFEVGSLDPSPPPLPATLDYRVMPISSLRDLEVFAAEPVGK